MLATSSIYLDADHEPQIIAAYTNHGTMSLSVRIPNAHFMVHGPRAHLERIAAELNTALARMAEDEDVAADELEDA
jgi:cell division protein ZapA (FtsZ GTPase activity inhibitor)